MYKEIEPTKSNTIHSPDLSKSPESVKYIPYGQLEGQKWSGICLGLLKLKRENVSNLEMSPGINSHLPDCQSSMRSGAKENWRLFNMVRL